MPLSKGRRGSNASSTRDGQVLPSLSRQNSRSDYEGGAPPPTAPYLPHGSVAAPSHSNNPQLEYARRHNSQAPAVTGYPQPTAGPALTSARAYEADQSYPNKGGGGRPVYKERRMTYDGVVSKKEVQPDTRDPGWSLGGVGSRFSVPLNDTPDFWNSAVGIRPASRGRSNSAASQKSNYVPQPMERPGSIRVRKNSLSKSSTHSIPPPPAQNRPYPKRNAASNVPNERRHPIKSMGQYLISTARWIGGWGRMANKRGRILSSTRQPIVRADSFRGRAPTRELYASPNTLKQQISTLIREDTPSRYERAPSLSRSRSRDKKADMPVLVRRSSDRSYRDTPRPNSHPNLDDPLSQPRPDRSLRRRGSDPLAGSSSGISPTGLISSLQALVAERKESREAERLLLDNTMHNAHNLKYNPAYDGYVPKYDRAGNPYETPIIRPTRQRRRVSDSHILYPTAYAPAPVSMQVAQPMAFTPSGYTPVQAPFVGMINPQHPLPPTVPGYFLTDTSQPIAGGHFSRRRGGSLGEMMWTPSIGRGGDIRQYH